VSPLAALKPGTCPHFADGYESGLNWKKSWDHLPGGPYVPMVSVNPGSHEWNEHCRLCEQHRQKWLEGWRQGIRDGGNMTPNLKKLIDEKVLSKLCG
jgi:hypothetical protein